MKNIFKTLLTLVAGSALLASCDIADLGKSEVKYASAISADKTEITFEASHAPEVTVNIKADGEWYIVAPSWITADPARGVGNCEVVFSAEDNLDAWKETAAPRSYEVAVCGTNVEDFFKIKANQKGESGLDATKYFKKVAKGDFKDGYAYLIVADVNGTLNACQPAGTGNDDNSYAYMFPTTITADETGKVTMESGSLCFYFEAVEGGYVIRQNKGNYLYQSASYANFYTTANKSNASVWTVDIAEDGLATIKNTSAGDRILQYDYAKYIDFGAWATVEDGYVLPYLYIDSAEPTDEILSVPESVTVGASATSAKIAVKSNKKWSVRCHDEMVKSFTRSGEGDGTIEVTFDANPSTTDSKVATLQIIGETTNVSVKLVQAPVMTTVAQLNDWMVAGNTSYEAVLKDAVVSYVNGSNAYIEDATGGMLLYKSGHGLVAGNKINGPVSGACTLYSNLPELTSMNVSAATVTTGAELPLTTITIADLLKDFNKYLSRRVKIVGVTVDKGVAARKDNGQISQNGKTLAVYAQAAATMETGCIGDIIAYPAVNKTTKQLSFWATADFKVTTPAPVTNDSKAIITDAKLPTAYPAEEATVSEDARTYAILNVANFGNGIQMKKGGSYIYNKNGLGTKIKSIKLNAQSGKTWYADNVTVYVGNASHPVGSEVTAVSNESGSTYTVDGTSSYFTIVNNSTYAVYMSSIEVVYEQ